MMYENVLHFKLPHSDPLVSLARSKILDELDPDSYEYLWYTTKNWDYVKYDYCDVLFEKDTLELISLNGNNIFDSSQSLKILGRYYVMKDKRNKYRSIQQVLIIPQAVDLAKSLNLKSVWYNFHCFDKRHQRYSDSQKRLINGGQVPEQYMPYWKEFKYVGQHMWNSVVQDKFEYAL